VWILLHQVLCFPISLEVVLSDLPSPKLQPAISVPSDICNVPLETISPTN
jgi:hypothetical protein